MTAPRLVRLMSRGEKPEKPMPRSNGRPPKLGINAKSGTAEYSRQYAELRRRRRVEMKTHGKEHEKWQANIPELAS